ncbi:haloacid dehalogenase [Bifidobacterium dolichotidis]|uniref:phosphomannomutase n=1 Tax=Bifidobacterium dolichotidis TaxID=2306976 RepID=A0A430FSK8_9BIFI|nr:HAD-IIB family hydrolase [Bifidobacterium dolichotidis]RSX55874.1 haloacid dehalogenase [Bifidobacterium dolichotidis]
MTNVQVPNWQDVNAEALFAQIRVAAFDLDGTLARSKKPMLPEMAQALSTMSTILPIAIVSGGIVQLLRSQVTDVLTPEANKANIHLMPTTGTRYYRWQDGDWKIVYKHDLSERDRQVAMDSLRRHAQELGLWPEHSYGPVLEDRGSQITFSALGQQAPVDLKEQWDPTNEHKNELAKLVQQDVPHLEVRSGGSTSVDVSAKGVDKAFAIRELAEELQVPISSILFVGDRMDPDGNDYPAACIGTAAVRVTGPEQTLELCQAYLAWHKRHTQQA